MLGAVGFPDALEMLDMAVMLWAQAEETLDQVWSQINAQLDAQVKQSAPGQ